MVTHSDGRTIVARGKKFVLGVVKALPFVGWALRSKPLLPYNFACEVWADSTAKERCQWKSQFPGDRSHRWDLKSPEWRERQLESWDGFPNCPVKIWAGKDGRMLVIARTADPIYPEGPEGEVGHVGRLEDAVFMGRGVALLIERNPEWTSHMFEFVKNGLWIHVGTAGVVVYHGVATP